MAALAQSFFLLLLLTLLFEHGYSLRFTSPTRYHKRAASLLPRRAELANDGDPARELLLEELEAEKLKLRAATLRLEAERAELELERASIAATVTTATATTVSS